MRVTRRAALQMLGAAAVGKDAEEAPRTFVMVVDDAGISAARAEALRGALLQFTNEQLTDGYAVAIIRTADGTASMERITGDRALTRAAIGQIRFNPAAGVPSMAPWRQTLHYTLAGLQTVPGRKAVVLFCDRMPENTGFDPIVTLANRAWASIYPVYSGENPEARNGFAALASATGGLSFGNDLSGALTRIVAEEARPQLQPPGVKPATEFPSAGSPQAELRTAVVRPNQAGDLRVSVWGWPDKAAGGMAGYFIEAELAVDPACVAFTHKLNGTYSGGLDLLVRAYDADGEIVDDTGRSALLSLTEEAHKQVMENALISRVRVPLAKPGVYQVYGAVRDSTSTNTGIAHRMVEVPSFAKGVLALSGLRLTVAAAAGQTEEPQPERVFHVGQKMAYECHVYGARPDQGGTARLEVRTAMFTGELAVFRGGPIDLSVEKAANQTYLRLRGAMELGRDTAPGDFRLQVTVRDTVGGQTASQWTEFTLK